MTAYSKKIKNGLNIFKETYNEWFEHNATTAAAALAYYTVFSLAPLVIIIVGVLRLITDTHGIQNDLLKRMDLLIGANGTEWLRATLEHMRKQSDGLLPTMIGVITLILGATSVFSELQSQLNRIWHIEARPGKNIFAYIRARLLSLGMILVVGFLLLVSLIADTIINILGDFARTKIPGLNGIGNIINAGVSFVLISFLFAAIFKYFPDAKILWRDVWSGAIMTAFLFTIGKTLIGLYLGKSAVVSTYGAAGSLVVLLVWVYYSSYILFFGAEFTQVNAKRKGHEALPRSYAKKISV